MDSQLESKPVTVASSAFDAPQTTPKDSFTPIGGSQVIQSYKAAPANPTPQPRPTRRPKVYQVQRGDTLYGIAQKFYGDPQQWKKIMRYNKDELRNSSSLKVGQRLYIPD
ncbi:LysM peptidoglycan-binding domain-containing protein [bacterium]|nr:LysM peptidoglycan-binding domain-containing protein [bacterium]